MVFWAALTITQKVLFSLYVALTVGVLGGLIAATVISVQSDSTIVSPTTSIVSPSSLPSIPSGPTWPNSIHLFDVSMSSEAINSEIAQVFSKNGGNVPSAFNGQFTGNPTALLFFPGTYDGVVVNVGYYTSVIGVGQMTSSVKLNNSQLEVQNGNKTDYKQGALDNFWRTCENLTVNSQQVTSWCVSQACPFRSIEVEGNVQLARSEAWDPPAPPDSSDGFASGGFMANCKIGGELNQGSQQQFCFRSCSFGTIDKGIWNMVYIGCEGGEQTMCDPNNHNASRNATNITLTSMAEKPFLVAKGAPIDREFDFELVVPPYGTRSQGFESDLYTGSIKIPKENIIVARDTFSISLINQYVSSGYHIILTPGKYQWEEPLVINHPNTIVYGMGMPIIEPTKGNMCIHVKDVPGVRISGLILQAGQLNSQTLLQVGDSTSSGSETNPTCLYDVFCRVGGPNETIVSADSMIVVNQHVILDDIWCWVADHNITGSGPNDVIGWDKNVCNNGLIVNGDHVTAHGLAIEHTQKDLVRWAGNHGRCNFFQSELNYFVPSTAAFEGVTGYHVLSGVTDHVCMGAGVYIFFELADVKVATAFKVDVNDPSPNILFHQPFTIYLGSNKQGSIEKILSWNNGSVGSVNPPAPQGSAYVLLLPSNECSWPV